MNVTLGIPRLREIIMSAKDEIKTPLISFECDDEETAQSIRRLLNKVKLADVIRSVTVSDVVKNKRNLVTVDIELDSEYPEQAELVAIKSMARQLQRLVSARIKTMSTQEVQSAAADEAQRGTGYKEGGDDDNGAENDNEESASSQSEETESKGHAEEQETDVVQCSDELFVLSNKYVTFENLEHVPNKRFKLVFSVDQCYHLLYLTFVEEAISKSTIHQVPGIDLCYLRQENGSWFVDVAGSNITAVCSLKNIKKHTITSNSIWTNFRTFGIEAARNAIIREASTVFSVYSINVDERHLALIADYMTQLGSIRSCSRNGIGAQPYPLAKASFERASYFVTEGGVHNQDDQVVQPSTSIALGELSKQGTGAFDLLEDLDLAVGIDRPVEVPEPAYSSSTE